ncbi:MAG TPA: lytic murein transglycosylase, partial [Nocardioides sp.]|nr:lytic murein transglycosylase [Nocardioides sp.]
VLGTRPAWDERVLRGVPDRLVPVVTANVASRREFRSMHDDLSPTLPAWRIVRPAPARDLLRYYRAAEREFGVGWEYLAAINLVETGMGRIRGTSVAGAQGPMQFIPTTWARWGEGDINSPRDAIRAAARYLAGSGFTRRGGIAGALFNYNNHSAYVRGVTLLARRMERDPRAFLGYYHWQIYYLTTEGDVLLPEGYAAHRPIPAKRWLERHPR